jgi:hypothetical protein
MTRIDVAFRIIIFIVGCTGLEMNSMTLIVFALFVQIWWNDIAKHIKPL